MRLAVWLVESGFLYPKIESLFSYSSNVHFSPRRDTLQSFCIWFSLALACLSVSECSLGDQMVQRLDTSTRTQGWLSGDGLVPCGWINNYLDWTETRLSPILSVAQMHNLLSWSRWYSTPWSLLNYITTPSGHTSLFGRPLATFQAY